MDNVGSTQFLNYYPKYSYLDDLLSLTKTKSLNIYVDLKGCLQSLYQEWAVKYIVNTSKDSTVVDISVFTSTLEFIAFHKLYAKKRNIDLNMFLFLESGKSSYHRDLLPSYKDNRHVGDFFGLDDSSRELFFKILDKNYTVIQKVCGKLPGVSVIRLMYLEADFVPYYLMNRVLPKEQVNAATNLIYSMDKDMLQCLDADNKFQFYRHYKLVRTLAQKDIFEHYTKKELNIPTEWFEMFLAITGDASDNFKGVPGIGIGRAIECTPQLIAICGGSMEKVFQNIKDKKPIFDKSYPVSTTMMKNIIKNEDIVVRNLKLLSFRLLSDAVDGGYPMNMVDQKKNIVESVNVSPKVPNAEVLIRALDKAELMTSLNESLIARLF